MTTVEEIYEAIQALPVAERLRLVERVVSDVTGGAVNGWPEGWFERTAGSIDDPTFMRHPQGEHETRDPLE